MSDQANAGCGLLVSVAVVFFLIGRCSAEHPEMPTAQMTVPRTLAEEAYPDVASPAESAASTTTAPADPDALEAVDTATLASAATAQDEPDLDQDRDSAPEGDLAAGGIARSASLAAATGDDGYTDVDGHHVQSPTFAPSEPSGASARCRDGSYSFSHHRRGTCSRHGGVAEWL